jgi:hypothetical protein
VVGI